MTYNLGSVGELAAALETGERALALATGEDELPTVLASNVVLARARYGLGDYRRAIETARRNDVLRLRSDDPHGPPNVAFARIWSWSETGESRGASSRHQRRRRRKNFARRRAIPGCWPPGMRRSSSSTSSSHTA